MIDEKRLVSLIGKEADSAEVTTLLADLGARAPTLKKGDVKAWLAVPEKGVDLVFSDEAHRSKRKDLAVGEGALVLTSIALRSSIPKYKDYKGPLPKGVVFGETPADAHKKLGPPATVHDFLPTDFWVLDNLELSVTYDDDRTRVEEVMLAEPQKK